MFKTAWVRSRVRNELQYPLRDTGVAYDQSMCDSHFQHPHPSTSAVEDRAIMDLSLVPQVRFVITITATDLYIDITIHALANVWTSTKLNMQPNPAKNGILLNPCKKYTWESYLCKSTSLLTITASQTCTFSPVFTEARQPLDRAQ